MRLMDLGPLRIVLDDGAERSAGGRRAAALLTMLVLHANRRVSVNDLVEAVWGDDAGAAAGRALETTVWRLRGVLEPDRPHGSPSRVLVNDSGGYRLVVAADQVDSLLFEQLSEKVRRLSEHGEAEPALATADEALRLWRGRPYEALDDELWARGRLNRLEELRAQTEELRIDALLAVGATAQALVDLEPLLEAEPYRERLWGQRMLALHRSGRTEEALATYRRIRRALGDDLGLDPGKELERLHQQVLSADPSLLRTATPAAPAPRSVRRVQLPAPKQLFGRDEEQDAVTHLLAPGVVTTLVGPAGSGKTELAVAVAWSAVEGLEDGAWYVDLSAVGQDAVPDAVAARLGLEVPPAAGVLDFLQTWAHDRSLLLLLDNCEPVLTGVGDVCRALGGGRSAVTVLATSREPLGVPGERVHRLPALPVTPGDGTEGPAVALFRARMTGVEDDRLPPDEVTRLIEDICSAVDGLPLAIELAAGLCEAYPLPDLAARVRGDPAHLASLGHDHPARHQSLHDAVDRSYRPLSADEQLVHRRLAVLPGPFTTEAAAAVAAPLPGWTLNGLLGRLVHRSLLTPLGGRLREGTTRFAQLSTVRGHARHLLDETGELAVAQAARDAFVRDLEAARPSSGRPENAAWLARVDDDLATVRATFESLRGREPDRAAHLARSTMSYWFYRGRGLEGRQWLESCVGQPGLSGGERALTQLALATLVVTQGQPERARRMVDAALPTLPGDVGNRHLGELSVSATTAFALVPDRDLKQRLLEPAREVLRATGSADLQVCVEAAACVADIVHVEADETLRRARRAYAEAVEVGNSLAAWISCTSGNAVALDRDDASGGMWWSRRLLEHQRLLGARQPSMQLETWGVFLAMADLAVPAVQVLAAAHEQTWHSGHPWPRLPQTEALLKSLRGSLPETTFQRAWTSGPALSLDELIEVVD